MSQGYTEEVNTELKFLSLDRAERLEYYEKALMIAGVVWNPETYYYRYEKNGVRACEIDRESLSEMQPLQFVKMFEGIRDQIEYSEFAKRMRNDFERYCHCPLEKASYRNISGEYLYCDTCRKGVKIEMTEELKQQIKIPSRQEFYNREELLKMLDY